MVQSYLQSSSQERPSGEKPVHALKMNKSTSQIFGKSRKRFELSRKEQLKQLNEQNEKISQFVEQQ
jgi:hypothetical protein